MFSARVVNESRDASDRLTDLRTPIPILHSRQYRRNFRFGYRYRHSPQPGASLTLRPSPPPPPTEQQYLSDVLELVDHADPQIRGATAILCGAILQAVLIKTRYSMHSWLAGVQKATGTTPPP